MMRAFLVCCSVTLLAGCSEPDQSQAAARSANDVHASQGADETYMVKGWARGDKAAWQNQIRARNQSQNEYLKTN